MKILAAAVLLVALTACTTDPPSETPATSDPSSQTPEAEPRWDPRDVDDLPQAAAEVARELPAVVDLPDVAPLLGGKPMSAAVLSVDRRGGRIQLLGVDGGWRELRLPNRGGRQSLSRVELSPDGTGLVALLDAGLELWDLPTGARTTLPLPRGFEPWDYSWIDWVDEDALLLDDLQGGWRIDTITGAAARVPYPTGMSFGWTVDDRGAVVEVDDPGEGNILTDWGRGVRRQIDMVPTGRLSSIQAKGDTIAGTSYERDGFAVYIADRLDLSPRHVLPLRDHDANYSNWALRTVGVLDDGSVLLWVGVPSRRPDVDGWRIVRWAPTTDRLEIVTTSGGDPTGPLTFAEDLLR